MLARMTLLVLAAVFVCASAFAMCGMCGGDGKSEESVYSHVAKEASVKGGVKEISYDQFMSIRNSGEEYKLLDVLSSESYNKGHIPGAESLPVDTINKETVEQHLAKDDHVIVYCGGFKCGSSTEAAKKLVSLGYSVVDYKGGLSEWQAKGNELT